MKKSIDTFVKTEEQFIKPVKVYLDFSYGNFDDFVISSSILDTSNKNDYIVFNSAGYIQGITKRVFNEIFKYSTDVTLESLYDQGQIVAMFSEVFGVIVNDKDNLDTY